jgi:hypothetical protein
VIAIADDAPVALHHAIERARDAHAQPLHGPPERGAIGRLDDHVHVIAEDGVVHQPKTEA